MPTEKVQAGENHYIRLHEVTAEVMLVDIGRGKKYERVKKVGPDQIEAGEGTNGEGNMSLSTCPWLFARPVSFFLSNLRICHDP